MSNDCSYNLNLSDHVFFCGKIWQSKKRKNQSYFICDDILKSEWDTWLMMFNGHLRLINCFKAVSKMKRLWVKDKQSDIFRLLSCLSGENTVHLFRNRPHANSYATNCAPRRFCMRHLDILVRMSQNHGLGRTLVYCWHLIFNRFFSQAIHDR